MVIVIARNVRFELRRGAGSSLEVLYGTVSLTPTALHSVATSVVLPFPTTFDLVNGIAIATNVAPSPAPVGGQVTWAYKVKIVDTHGKSFEYLVGVPDGTTEINFNVLPRYFETEPPLFGEGPQGIPGAAATIAIGTTTSGPTPTVTNTGTSKDAILNFTLAQGPTGPAGAGFAQIAAKPASDIPTTYPMGASVFWNGTTDIGYPFIRGQVVTVRSASDRASQTIYNTSSVSGTRVLTRESVGSTSGAEGWGPFKEYAWNDVATTAVNGLMSAADKTKLDANGTLPLRGKLLADAPSTYPMGYSVVLVDLAGGWPSPTTVESSALMQVTSSRNKDRFGGVTQWLSAFGDETAPIMYRVSGALDTWGAFKTVGDSSSLVSKGTQGVLASDYGALGATVGDGINNDYWTIQRAINDSKGKDVWLEGDKTYFIGGTLSMPADGGNRVSIRTLGPKPAKLLLGAGGQSYNAINFQQPTMSVQTTLTAPIGQNQHGWQVASTAGIEPDMICEVVSTVLWYFDARNDAFKSELHRVKQVIGNKVYFHDPSMDGYVVVGETVALKFFKPIYVTLENIEVVGILPAVAEETNASTGIGIQHAIEPILTNVNTDSCARTGIYLDKCYRPKVIGGRSIRSNNYYNGYGVQLSGCTHGIIRDRFNYHGRRAVDVSGADVVSRMTTIENCTAVGGGWNSRGTQYGFTDEGTTGGDQYGFGSHGPADQTRYIQNTTLGIQRPYIVRGRDEVIVNMRHVGRTHGGVVQLSFGVNIFISGGTVTSGTWAYKNGSPQITGQSQGYWRPDCFIRNYPGYQVNPPSGAQRGRIIIKGVTAEVKHIFMWMSEGAAPGGVPLGALTIADCDVHYWPEDGTRDKYLIWSDAVDSGPTSKSRWYIGPNRQITDAGTGANLLAFNLSLSSANVLNYTVMP